MSILDYIEVWWRSLQPAFAGAGVVAHFERSSEGVLNPSCSLNLRRGELEADLVVWASGEAELATMEPGGSISHKHYDDLRNVEDMQSVLLQLVALMPSPK